MSQPNIKQLKASDLSAEELRLQKAQQVIDGLYTAANSDEMLKKQLEAATNPESLVEIAARQGHELTVADIEALRRRTQQQAQLNSDEFDDDELNEQELELVAGGISFNSIFSLNVQVQASHSPNKPKSKSSWWPW
jgi:predicted ribosomally synthesized peptide with nif11-like leader